ncbi:HU family DNA-binding protein [candidate division KSB1 bacterium]|nr:MAG: HU family DNA-binding protein [candidate division KSB1 bacterium]
MTREELTVAVAAKTGITREFSSEVVTAVFETIADIIRDGDKVTVTDFGTFFLGQRAARQGRNPRTGEKIEIPARKVPRFTPAKKLKEIAK